MLRDFQLITNFGCDKGCSYCIWKNHPLKDVKTDIDSCLEVLKDELLSRPYLDKFSISGGGDPFNQETNHLFWPRLIELLKSDKVLQKLKFDIYTAYQDELMFDEELYDMLIPYTNQLVLNLNPHVKFNSKLYDIYRKDFKLRLNYVVIDYPEITERTEIDELIKIERYAERHRLQLTYRKLMNNTEFEPKPEVHKFCARLETRMQKLGRYIRHANIMHSYREYMMPNNIVYEGFFLTKSEMEYAKKVNDERQD